MSGTITSNVARVSGTIAATPGGLSWDTAVVTGSTVTVEAGNGYFINTTSNTCTVTLPSSAEAGDQIVFADYARTWASYALILDSNGLNFQGDADTFTVDYDTAGQSLNIVYSDSTKGWLPVSDDAVADVPEQPNTQKAIFAYGSNASGPFSLSNLVNSSGVVASDVTGVGTARAGLAAAGYGVDKAIFAYGTTGGADDIVSMSNLVSNSGVIATDVSGVGTARSALAAARYGTQTAIFAYGGTASVQSMSNLVNSSGVIASDVSGVGTARQALAAAEFGGISSRKAIFAFGQTSGNVSMSNLVNTSGVIASDVTGVGTARRDLGAAGYGSDKAIFAYGYISGYSSLSNLVSNSGVVASDVTGVGTARSNPGNMAAGYSTSA